ncbi:MAG: TfoX/Sxy family protein [Desulforegulaceae bacterium]|nr:TfoX/Sxy family protein [Desulforegulaceae bacterium]
MASDENFVKFISEQIESAGQIRYRKMFGEYALYCNEKVVALICDNQLFIKPSNAGREFIGNVVEQPPYKGAKPSFLIEDQIENKEWLCELIRLTEMELPETKKKKSKTKKKTQ